MSSDGIRAVIAQLLCIVVAVGWYSRGNVEAGTMGVVASLIIMGCAKL